VHGTQYFISLLHERPLNAGTS